MSVSHVTSWETASDLSFGNRAQVGCSATAGCYHCHRLFPASEVDETAVCPHCGIDAVLGDASGLPIAEPGYLEGIGRIAFTARDNQGAFTVDAWTESSRFGGGAARDFEVFADGSATVVCHGTCPSQVRLLGDDPMDLEAVDPDGGPFIARGAVLLNEKQGGSPGWRVDRIEGVERAVVQLNGVPPTNTPLTVFLRVSSVSVPKAP